MGVDYTALAGLGFQVNLDKYKPLDEDELTDDDFDHYEFFDNLLKETNFEWFEVGEGAYTGRDNDYYVVLSNPDFYKITDLIDEMHKLRVFLLENKLIDDSENIGIVGGLLIN